MSTSHDEETERDPVRVDPKLLTTIRQAAVGRRADETMRPKGPPPAPVLIEPLDLEALCARQAVEIGRLRTVYHATSAKCKDLEDIAARADEAAEDARKTQVDQAALINELAEEVRTYRLAEMKRNGEPIPSDIVRQHIDLGGEYLSQSGGAVAWGFFFMVLFTGSALVIRSAGLGWGLAVLGAALVAITAWQARGRRRSP